MGGSFSSGGGSASKSRSREFTRLPSEFLADYARVAGAPITLDELLRGAPRTTGLFDSMGGGAWYNPGFRPGPSAAPAQMGQDQAGTGAGIGAALRPRGVQHRGGSASYLFDANGQPNATSSMNQMRYADPWYQYAPAGTGGNTPGERHRSIGNVLKNVVIGDVRDVGGDLKGISNFVGDLMGLNPPKINLGPEMNRYSNPGQILTDYRMRFAPDGTAPGVGGALPGGIGGAIRNVGFGDAPREYAAPVISSPSIAPGGYARMEDAIFRSQFDPVARELTRQGSLNDRDLRAQLSGAGLASSAAGLGLQQRQQRERMAQLEGAATDAANRAVAQRYDLQLRDAGQVLQGNMANAENYLRTIGLNQESANQARAQLLGLLGIQQQDLARMDQQKMQAFTAILDTYLRQLGTIGQLGRERYSDEESATKGRLSVAASMGGGGGVGF